jgi:sulfite reductase (NADPH) hemoprotein beta-component
MYQLHLGGGVDAHGARFGKQVVKIIARRVPAAVVLLLRLFDAHHAEGESPQTFFARVDPKLVVSSLASVLRAPPTHEEEVDLGERVGFVVETRKGECAA